MCTLFRGISSDSPFLPSKLGPGDVDIVFLPTVSGEKPAERTTRMYAVKWGDDEYIIVTRPLYLDVASVLEEASRLRSRGYKVVASIVSDKLSGYLDLLDKLKGRVDMVEIDLGLFYAVYGYRRGFESYALDILEELVPLTPVPLAAKFSPNMPLSREFLGETEKIGVNMLVFSTHPVYTVDGNMFRVHSTHLSLIYGSIWRSIVSQGLNSVKVITVDDMGRTPSHVFTGFLYDTALIAGRIGSMQVENSFPTEWRRIPQGVLPAIVSGAEQCRHSCPLGAFGEEGEGTVVASPEVCDLCGLCISLCGSRVTLARELSPL